MEFSRSLFFLIIFFTGFVSLSKATNFYVGGKDGWVLNPSEDYSHWAGRNRFQVNDSLIFKYNKGSDSVLLVSKDDYYRCNRDNPITEMDSGVSVFTFDRSGPFFFISGNSNGSCEKGQKFFIIVMAVRSPPSSPVVTPPAMPPMVAPPVMAPTVAPPVMAPMIAPPVMPPVYTPATSPMPPPPISVTPGMAPVYTPAMTPLSPTPAAYAPVMPPISPPTPAYAPAMTPITPSPSTESPMLTPGYSPSPSYAPTMTPMSPSMPPSSSPEYSPTYAPTMTPLSPDTSSASPSSTPGSIKTPASSPKSDISPSDNINSPAPAASSAWRGVVTPPALLITAITVLLSVSLGNRV